jgi:dTDP-glucose pyrophosphorylase
MVQIVIPMAGRGSRFADAGFETPKPLIDVFGEPMFDWAVRSLPVEQASRIIFVCLAEHLECWPLREEIERRYAHLDPVVIAARGVTEGQACSVLLAREYIDNHQPLMIYNADTHFVSGLGETLANLNERTDGVISVFRAEDDRWSFAAVDDRGWVTRVAEKEPISPWATVGMYYFRRGRDFVAAVDEMMRRDLRTRGEFFVGPAYNLLIRDGGKVILDPIEKLWCMGTPEQLEQFKASYPQERIARSARH